MDWSFNIGFLQIKLVDLADMLLVAYLIYRLYKMVRGSVAFKILIGIMAIYLLYQFVKSTGMELLTTILGQFMGVGVIATVVLFQQEIRKILMMVGKNTFISDDSIFRIIFGGASKKTEIDLIPIVEASKAMSNTHQGALIVFSRSSELKFYAETGDTLDATISKRLLVSLFFKNSPMHDGAVIISDGRIKAARCILPVSENQELPASLGLRHRAALGLTEVTDAIVLVISEETGQMSLAHNGVLEHNLSASELRAKIHYYLYETEEVVEEELKPQEAFAG